MFDTSIRSPLSCPWGVICQQAATGPHAMIRGAGAFLTLGQGCPSRPSPWCCPLPAPCPGSSLWKPRGSGVRQCTGRAGPDTLGMLLLTGCSSPEPRAAP